MNNTRATAIAPKLIRAATERERLALDLHSLNIQVETVPTETVTGATKRSEIVRCKVPKL